MPALLDATVAAHGDRPAIRYFDGTLSWHELDRQSDALAKVGRWYLLPFAPGLALMMLAPVVENGPQALLRFSPGAFVSIGVICLVFLGVWWLNRRAAAKLQRAIDELDALTREPG